MSLAKQGFLLALSFFCQCINAQSYDWIDTEFKGQACLGIFDVEGSLIAVTGNGPSIDINPLSDYQIGFYRIDLEENSTNFVLVRLISIPNDEYFAAISVEYINTTNEWLIAQSTLISESRQLYRFLLLDHELNVKSVDSMELLGYPEIFQIQSDSSRTYLLGGLTAPPQNTLIFLNYNYSNIGELPILEIGQTLPEESSLITSMKIDPITKNMYIFYGGGIQVIDTNLNQLVVKRTFEIGTGNHGDIIKIDNKYYSHGLSRVESGIRRLVYQQYDTSFNILETVKLGNIDKDNYPFVSKSLDYRDNEFLIGAHLDGPANQFNVIETIKRFYLAKYDNDLELIWYKEYGGDNAYWFTGLKILEDQSCMAYGFITDTIEDIRYPYIMRVDKDGNFITSTTFVPDDGRVHVSNNGQGDMVVLNPDLYEYQIALYDIAGIKILDRKSSAASEIIDLGFVPTTSLVYTILFNDGRVSTGLFVNY